jgi:hypothetical protein
MRCVGFVGFQDWITLLSAMRFVVIGGLVAVVVAGPAKAVDCFPKIRVAEAHQVAPPRPAPPHRQPVLGSARHNAHHVRHVIGSGPRKLPRLIVASRPHALNLAESSFVQQTIPIYVPRPVSCDDKAVVAIQSLPPSRPVPPAQKLLDALAGPLASPEAPAAPPSAFGDVPGSLPGGVPGGVPGVVEDLPGGGVPGGGIPIGGVPSGGVPSGGIPGGGIPSGGVPGGGQPPVLIFGGPPPDVMSPVLPPEGGQPPIIIPAGTPITPPESPPVIAPVDTSPVVIPTAGPQPPVTAVPEPRTWALLILGALGIGARLRLRPRTAAELRVIPQ